MSEKIYPKIINGKTYYYLQSIYREKINPNDKGKNRGSGKSKVKTKNIYLGSASAIKKKLLTIKDVNGIEINFFSFVVLGLQPGFSKIYLSLLSVVCFGQFLKYSRLC